MWGKLGGVSKWGRPAKALPSGIPAAGLPVQKLRVFSELRKRYDLKSLIEMVVLLCLYDMIRCIALGVGFALDEWMDGGLVVNS